MNKVLISLACCASLAASISQPAMAWNRYGHMVIGYIAFSQLDPQKKDRVAELLKKNPSRQWKKYLNRTDKSDSAQIGAIAGRWADDWKGEGAKKVASTAADSGDMHEAFKDKQKHKSWHYVNYPFSTDGTNLPANMPTPNVETQITKFREVIASDARDAEKAYCLVWLFHLVGDVHQPLHAVTRCTHDHATGDEGGNKVALHTEPNELHAFWDSAAGDKEEDIDGAVTLAKSLAKPTDSEIDDQNLSDWIKESVDIAKSDVYKPPVGPEWGGENGYDVSDEYRSNAKRIAEKRISLAGYRLAKMLNNELK